MILLTNARPDHNGRKPRNPPAGGKLDAPNQVGRGKTPIGQILRDQKDGDPFLHGAGNILGQPRQPGLLPCTKRQILPSCAFTP